MNDEANNYNGYIIKDILSNNEFNIQKVINLKDINTFFFHQGIHAEVEKIINEKRFEDLVNETISQECCSDYLSIMSFEDEKEQKFLATIYDSDDLWQNPVVVKIFPL